MWALLQELFARASERKAISSQISPTRSSVTANGYVHISFIFEPIDFWHHSDSIFHKKDLPTVILSLFAPCQSPWGPVSR